VRELRETGNRYNLHLERLLALKNEMERKSLDHALFILSPLFLVFALSIRATKASAEIRVLKNS
jgi:hypothetical protein